MSELLHIDPIAARFDPAGTYREPDDLAGDIGLTRGQKLAALSRWAEAIQERFSATSEGMPANGHTSVDLEMLEKIEVARLALNQIFSSEDE